MKRSIFVAAIATLAAGSALAQSSVSVYGRLNMTVERIAQGGQNIYRLNDNASRLGFRGVEDLGGGMKASFLMEHRFSADTGTAAAPRFWDGESWVGLEGGFGKVRLGYFGPSMAYFTTADYISMHNHDTGTSSDAFYAYSSFPLQNAISYTSPSIGGLVIDAQLGLSENSQAGRKYALSANYVAGPLYELGDFTVGAYYIRNDGTFGAGTKRDAYRGAVMYTMGPGEVHLNVGRAGDIKGLLGDQSATQLSIGYNHNLSKRTKAYTYYSRVSDDARFYTGKFGTFALGVRHNF